MATERRWAGAAATFLSLAWPAAGLAQRMEPDSAAPPPEAARALHFLTVGVAAGSPGYANVTTSYFFSRAALRLTAGAGGRGRSGVQGDIVWRFVREANLSVGAALVGGTFTSREPSADNVAGTGDLQRQVYVGAALDVFYGGFHLQTGLAHGFRDYPPNRQLLSQFGYEWRIR